MNQEELEHELERTKMAMVIQPDMMYYTSIFMSLVYKWGTDVTNTMAVDGRHMYVNPHFFAELTPELRISGFCHEVLHVSLHHITRGRDHEMPESNEAADYVVNWILVQAGYPLGENWLYDNRFADMSYEQVYKILMDEKKKNNGQSSPLKGLDGNGKPCNIPRSGNGPANQLPGMGTDVLPPATQAEADEIEAEVTDMVLKAVTAVQQTTKSWGSIPGAVLVELDKSLNPKLPWHIIFHNYMSEFAKDDYTWRRPNRRYLPDLIMPSAYSERCSNLVFAVDTSCSVSNEEFGFFVQEIDVVQQELNPEKITIIDFDTKIHEVHEVTQDISVLNDIKFTGRGGTNVHPVLKWAQENNPEVIAIFTDGWFSQPQEADYPDCPVLWMIYNNEKFTPAQGDVIQFEL